MYATLRRLYFEGRLNDAGLDNAVKLGWITAEQRDQIIADKAGTPETEG